MYVYDVHKHEKDEVHVRVYGHAESMSSYRTLCTLHIMIG